MIFIHNGLRLAPGQRLAKKQKENLCFLILVSEMIKTRRYKKCFSVHFLNQRTNGKVRFSLVSQISFFLVLLSEKVNLSVLLLFLDSWIGNDVPKCVSWFTIVIKTMKKTSVSLPISASGATLKRIHGVGRYPLLFTPVFSLSLCVVLL